MREWDKDPDLQVCNAPNCERHGKSPCAGVGCDGMDEAERRLSWAMARGQEAALSEGFCEPCRVKLDNPVIGSDDGRTFVAATRCPNCRHVYLSASREAQAPAASDPSAYNVAGRATVETVSGDVGDGAERSAEPTDDADLSQPRPVMVATRYVIDRDGDLWQSLGDGTWRCLTTDSCLVAGGDLRNVCGPLTELVPLGASVGEDPE